MPTEPDSLVPKSVLDEEVENRKTYDAIISTYTGHDLNGDGLPEATLPIYSNFGSITDLQDNVPLTLGLYLLDVTKQRIIAFKDNDSNVIIEGANIFQLSGKVKGTSPSAGKIRIELDGYGEHYPSTSEVGDYEEIGGNGTQAPAFFSEDRFAAGIRVVGTTLQIISATFRVITGVYIRGKKVKL